MAFSRISLRLIIGFIPFLLFSGCGDLEPEMQDTRAVVLKMNLNQRSSSRSSQISQAEVSSHKTHLILALPSWENFSSSYKNYYSSFAQELMNPLDNKVSLEIPLNTQMKIFAFLFKQDYTMPQLFSGVREVGYYGESQPFSIGTNTNSLSLGITLQSAGTADGNNDGEDSNGDGDYENEGGYDGGNEPGFGGDDFGGKDDFGGGGDYGGGDFGGDDFGGDDFGGGDYGNFDYDDVLEDTGDILGDIEDTMEDIESTRRVILEINYN